jgi:hypothetical protein
VFHLMSFRGVEKASFRQSGSLPRVLAHIMNAATPDASQEIDPPKPITAPIPCPPIVRDGMLRQEGLLNVFRPLLPIACPCVFKSSGWAQRPLLAKELLRAFDMPLDMDSILLTDRRARGVLQRSVTPIVVAAVFCLLWTHSGGGRMDMDVEQQMLTANDTTLEGSQEKSKTPQGNEENHETQGEGTGIRGEAEIGELTAPNGTNTMPSHLALFAKLKMEHNLAKAVKSDDAEVPIYLWDQAVWKGPPSEAKKAALVTLRWCMLGGYQQRLWLDARKYLRECHGANWPEQIHKGSARAIEDGEVVHDILWRSAGNDWFEYPLGSRLIFFPFSARYCIQAMRGVKVLYMRKGPSSKQRQPPLKPDEMAILQKKLKKFIDKKYLAPPPGHIGSLIKYFAIPKGVIGNVVQDWRIVFHAGANKLNDCIWAPSFSLPTVNSLLQITDERALMRDQDLGKMFLLFQLHPNTVKFTAVDLGPLQFNIKECPHRWVCWARNLMGFKSLPYNSVRMYLISEEIIRGDCHDLDNAFQWHSIMLNLPGTKGYKPALSWISKRQNDGSLASDFVCFVDDL